MEFEYEDGMESEVKGFIRFFIFKLVYVRVWIGIKVMIIDIKEGIKFMNKKVKKVKIIFGFFGYWFRNWGCCEFYYKLRSLYLDVFLIKRGINED